MAPAVAPAVVLAVVPADAGAVATAVAPAVAPAVDEVVALAVAPAVAPAVVLAVVPADAGAVAPAVDEVVAPADAGAVANAGAEVVAGGRANGIDVVVDDHLEDIKQGRKLPSDIVAELTEDDCAEYMQHMQDARRENAPYMNKGRVNRQYNLAMHRKCINMLNELDVQMEEINKKKVKFFKGLEFFVKQIDYNAIDDLTEAVAVRQVFLNQVPAEVANDFFIDSPILDDV